MKREVINEKAVGGRRGKEGSRGSISLFEDANITKRLVHISGMAEKKVCLIYNRKSERGRKPSMRVQMSESIT